MSFGLRTSLMGIKQDSMSCWFAATLQAIVDCPALVEAIYLRTSRRLDDIERIKKEWYLNRLLILHEMCRIEEENESTVDVDVNDTFIVGEKTLALSNYPVNETVLETGVDKSKDPHKIYVDKETYKKFRVVSSLPILNWIEIIKRSSENLEVLIRKNKFLTIEQLHSALGIFNQDNLSQVSSMSVEDLRYQPFFWSDLEFNELLNDYLYTLIFNRNARCLSSMPLRDLMLSSMRSVSHQLLYQQISTDFIAYIMGVSNPLYFLSVIFGNLSLTTETTETTDGLSLPRFGSDFLRCARTISLPQNISMYENLSDIVKSDQLEYDPMVGTFNFLIIENPAILAARNYPGASGPAHEIWKTGLHPFTTNKQIDFFGESYTLCSVIIYVGGGHYITLSNIGNFNDGRVEPGTEALNKFCKNSKYNGNPGYLWFYQKTSYDSSGLKSRMVEPERSNQEILCSSASRSTFPSVPHSSSAQRTRILEASAQSRPNTHKSDTRVSSKSGEVYPLYLVKYKGSEVKFFDQTCLYLIQNSNRYKTLTVDYSLDPSENTPTGNALEVSLFKTLVKKMVEWQEIEKKNGKKKYEQKYLKYKQKYLKLKNM
jgi:hypothetical protein